MEEDQSGLVFAFSETSPIERSGHSATFLNDKIWIFGGYTGDTRMNDLWSLTNLGTSIDNILLN